VVHLTALLLAAASPDAGILLARPLAISADHFEILNKQHNAVYQGHAKVIRDSTTMTCDELTIEYVGDKDVSRILARGNVEAVDGDRWAAGDTADFDNHTGVLVVRGNPRARQGHREVEGEEVTFTTGIDRLFVTKAHTRMEDDKTPGANKKVAIDADTLTLDEQKNLATWRGHVRARRGDTLLLGPELVATYDEQGVVTRVEGHQGVEAFEGDRWARGKHAVYDVASGVLVCTGNPEARQGKGNKMSGSKVTFRSGSDLLEVENAKSIIQVDKKKP
jgi:lipopolysaccharide transport protein LptA